jgi:nucleoid-associated protein
MSNEYEVHSVVVHQLIKEAHGKSRMNKRMSCLEITEPVKDLVLNIHHLFGKRPGKGYGRFESDTNNFPSSRILSEVFREKTKDFFVASCELLSILANRADSAPLSTGGYVLMAYISESKERSWFIVAILNNVHSSLISDDMEIIDVDHVDLEHLRVAGRVDLDTWMSDDKNARYIGFLKKKGEVSDYFKYFLGCNELLVALEETNKLVKVLKEFSKQKGLSPIEEEEFLQRSHDYLSNQDGPISLQSMANAVWSNNPSELQEAFSRHDIQIADGFIPDKRGIKSLVKMKYKTKFWTLDLDRHALTQGYAQYNQEEGELILKQLPDALKKELRQEMDDGE